MIIYELSELLNKPLIFFGGGASSVTSGDKGPKIRYYSNEYLKAALLVIN